jgi:hypothetical protein
MERHDIRKHNRLRYKIKYWHTLRNSFLRSEAKVTEFYQGVAISSQRCGSHDVVPTFGAAAAKEPG